MLCELYVDVLHKTGSEALRSCRCFRCICLLINVVFWL